jgi:perosamine synthetase
MFYPYVSKKAIQGVLRVMQDRWIGQGALVSQFEQAVQRKLGIPYAIAVNVNSAALHLALTLSKVAPGTEVITTPMACTATNHPILEQFATPIFADIQLLTGNIDPADVEHRITERTRAILCYDWGGYPCDLDELKTLAYKHDLVLIEDASEALGATYRNRYIGSIADFTAFSFQAINLLTTGEGGMLCVLNEATAQRASVNRWYAIDRKNRKPNALGYYDFDIVDAGYGYHLTNIAAAMGLAHIDEVDTLLLRRAEIAAYYRRELEGVPGLRLFELASDRTSANHLFTIHVEDRLGFCEALRRRGVETSIIHARNDQYSIFGGLRADLPTLDQFNKTYIAIPIHCMLKNEQVNYVIESIRKGW